MGKLLNRTAVLITTVTVILPLLSACENLAGTLAAKPDQVEAVAAGVTITGLPPHFDGVGILVALQQNDYGELPFFGEGVVRNGSVTVELQDRDGNPWSETGSWYAAFAENGGEGVDVFYITKTRLPFNSGSASIPYSSFVEMEIDVGKSAPSTPAGVTATAQSASSVSVSWDAVSGASGYYVYRGTGSSDVYALIAETSATAYTDTELSASTTYYYSVSAYNSAGESAQSYDVSATTSVNVPAAPTGVTATAQSASSVSVSWGSVSGASGYRVYRGTGSSGVYALVAETSATAYTDTGLSVSATYYYKVGAYNSAGESAQSSYGSATTSANVPAVPTGVTATAQSASSVSVSWGSVSGASGYRVYRGTSNFGYFLVAETSATAYTDTGLSASTTYYYKVSAYNSAGESAQSYDASATTSANVPAAPTGVTAMAQSSSSVSVSWGSVSGASGYRVYRWTSSSGAYALVAETAATAYTDMWLSASTTYYYSVSAYNSAGESAQSYDASATTSADAPAAPTGVTATAQSSSSVSVSWGSVSGASGYRVYRWTSSSGAYALVAETSATAYTDMGLSASTSYYYSVSAYNSAGESAQSNYAYASTSAPSPSDGNLSITVGFNLGAIAITGNNGANTIRRTGSPGSLTLSAEGYTGVVWYVDGSTPGINGNTVSINAGDYDARIHSVTFTGYKNGTPYAQVIPFTVLD
jgi:fibronectin type 3 domain-containing protein